MLFGYESEVDSPSAASLPASVVYNLLIAQYVLFSCLTLCLWDWILASYDEYRMLRKNDQPLGRLTITIYFLARIAPVASMIINLVLSINDFKSCITISVALAIADALSTPSFSALFLLRVSAVYLHNKIVIAVFGAMWLFIFICYLVGSIALPKEINHIYGTNKCASTFEKAKIWGEWGFRMNAIFDTLIYLAISWQLASLSVPGKGWKTRFRAFFKGDSRLHLFKALLQSGQVYYFVTFGFSVATAVTTDTSSIPLLWRGLISLPNMTLQSVLACRLFRELKLGIIRDDVHDTLVASSIHFRAMPMNSMQSTRNNTYTSSTSRAADVEDSRTDLVVTAKTRGSGEGSDKFSLEHSATV